MQSVVTDKKSVVTGTSSQKRHSLHEKLKILDYKAVLHIIREIEEQINNFSEVYTKMIERSKGSIKIDREFKEVLRVAEQTRKFKKYFEQKDLKAKMDAEKKARMLEKMILKQAVERIPGKIQMIRMNVPSHEKTIITKKKIKTDFDMLKYFGEDVDWEELEKNAQKTETE